MFVHPYTHFLKLSVADTHNFYTALAEAKAPGEKKVPAALAPQH
jgi:hypothetical protein